jgi:hypothetical protein
MYFALPRELCAEHTGTRKLICSPEQLGSDEPHCIVTVLQWYPAYIGGPAVEIDTMLSIEAYNKWFRRLENELAA